MRRPWPTRGLLRHWKKKNGNECGKDRVRRSSTQITIDQQQQDNVESFIYLCSKITNDASCSREVKYRIAMAKAALT
jgi:hypothetical protein